MPHELLKEREREREGGRGREREGGRCRSCGSGFLPCFHKRMSYRPGKRANDDVEAILLHPAKRKIAKVFHRKFIKLMTMRGGGSAMSAPPAGASWRSRSSSSFAGGQAHRRPPVGPARAPWWTSPGPTAVRLGSGPKNWAIPPKQSSKSLPRTWEDDEKAYHLGKPTTKHHHLSLESPMVVTTWRGLSGAKPLQPGHRKVPVGCQAFEK